MTFFRIFSAVSPDTRFDYYDDTCNSALVVDAVEHLVRSGSGFSVWVYSSRSSFQNGADPYAVLTYEGGGNVVTVSDIIGGWSDKRSVRMHMISATPIIISERVGARLRTLAKRYSSIY